MNTNLFHIKLNEFRQCGEFLASIEVVEVAVVMDFDVHHSVPSPVSTDTLNANLCTKS